MLMVLLLSEFVVISGGGGGVKSKDYRYPLNKLMTGLFNEA